MCMRLVPCVKYDIEYSDIKFGYGKVDKFIDMLRRIDEDLYYCEYEVELNVSFMPKIRYNICENEDEKNFVRMIKKTYGMNKEYYDKKGYIVFAIM